MTNNEIKYYDEEGEEYEDYFEYLRDKYVRVSCLLCYFHVNTDKTDIDTIKKFANVQSFDTEYIQQTINQAKAVRKLDPFPYEWISQATNKALSNINADSEQERYFKWLDWVVEALEKEAKKAGKI